MRWDTAVNLALVSSGLVTSVLSVLYALLGNALTAKACLIAAVVELLLAAVVVLLVTIRRHHQRGPSECPR